MTVTENPALMMRYRALLIAFVCVLLVGCIVSAAEPVVHVHSHLLAPKGLRCGNQREPLAVSAARPQFSWELVEASALLHAVSESAYQVEVRLASGSRDVVWDSGKVNGGATFGVSYAGRALEPGVGYEWRVRAWDEGDHASAWSGWAHWTQAPVWRASWIGGPGEDDKPDAPMPIFRKGFVLDKPVKRALLYATGLGQYEVRVNGHKAGEDELAPGWTNYRKTVDFDSYDVTGLLRKGGNAIGVMLGNGMYRVFETKGRYTKFAGVMGPLKCLLQLHVELADGQTVEVMSDGSWKTAPGPITFSSTYGGEDFDARKEPVGWDRAGFDDAGWRAVQVVDGPGGALTPEIAPPLRVMKTYPSVKVSHPKAGVAVYDLGQNFAGWPAIRVAGRAGVQVKMIPGELLNSDGTVSQASAGEPQWFSYTLRGGGVEEWHPRFSYYGFRYVQVEEGEARTLSMRGEAVHSSSEATGSFESSETLLNRIHALILRAIENNSVSLFTDCPHREKLGWLEQTHLMAPSMLYDFDFAGLFAATAQNIADTQKTDGPKKGMVAEIAPQYVVFEPPDGGVFDDSPEWGSAAVLAPWYAFERSGDRAFLEAQLNVMRNYVSYLGTRAKDGIVAYGLGDWYDIGPGEPGMSKLTTAGVTATATYYQDLRVMEMATALLGHGDESREYARIAEAEKSAFNARFFDSAGHRYDKGSQTAQAMPLAVGLVPEGERDAVLKALVDDIRAHNNHVTAGDIGYHYVVDALLDGGRSDVLLDMLERTDTPSYGYQLAQGATALTEAWDANPSSSQDHFMLGHAEEWFYRGLGGIDLDFSRAATEQLEIRPRVVGKLGWVRTSYRSVLGVTESDWRKTEDGLGYLIRVPANATAAIELDAGTKTDVRVNGNDLRMSPGVVSFKRTANGVHLVVASGRYDIRVTEHSR